MQPTLQKEKSLIEEVNFFPTDDESTSSCMCSGHHPGVYLCQSVCLLGGGCWSP